MTKNKSNNYSFYSNESWIKVRTLINLRWLAIFGQLTTVIFTYFFLNITFNFFACIGIIFISCIFNILSTYFYSPSKRLSGFSTFLILSYDLFQLSILLYFSGGMTNPFSILIIVPVIVSATSLSILFLITLAILTILNIIVLSFVYSPIYDPVGFVLEPPHTLLIGFCTSLVITVTFLGGYARRVSIDTLNMNKALQATQVELERERKLAAIAGVVAALGHELGFPLSTIKLASSELLEDLEENDQLFSDIKLIFNQANRCKAILADMGSLGKDDQYVKVVDLLELISEAIEPYKKSGKNILLSFNGNYFEKKSDTFNSEKIPRVRKEPELIHGIRNLIQNGVKYSNSCVQIELSTNMKFINIVIFDDGPGFPESLLKMIGDPFLNKKENPLKDFNGTKVGQGMGLGLFISKILLERTGSIIKFSNLKGNSKKVHSSATGAQIEIAWIRTALEVPEDYKEVLSTQNPRNID